MKTFAELKAAITQEEDSYFRLRRAYVEQKPAAEKADDLAEIVEVLTKLRGQYAQMGVLLWEQQHRPQ